MNTTNTAAASQKMPRKPTGKLAFAYDTIKRLEAQIFELRTPLAAPAQAATAKQSPHPEYDKGFSDGWNRCEARQAAAPAQAGEYPPLGKGSLWRDADGIRGYGADPGPGPWYAAKDVHRAIDADRAARGATQAAPALGEALPAGWLAVHYASGAFYSGPLKTEAEAKRYIQDVEQSSDSVTLRARPFAWVDAQAAPVDAAQAKELAELRTPHPADGEMVVELHRTERGVTFRAAAWLTAREIFHGHDGLVGEIARKLERSLEQRIAARAAQEGK